MRKEKERRRLEAPAPEYARDLPELRKVIIVIDFDQDTPVINTMRCYRSDRLDCYNTTANGKPWRQRVGMSHILAGIRKSMPPVRAL